MRRLPMDAEGSVEFCGPFQCRRLAIILMDEGVCVRPTVLGCIKGAVTQQRYSKDEAGRMYFGLRCHVLQQDALFTSQARQIALIH
ncbi:hypothetical protein RRG08_064567 [Elysia crispata]|uniref:Uncharacterized protein n=1 Tax=Elysia crispata TaxID=231223 RepID=A0AAE1EDG1_9GAST|nr:hypothetical protein RRG08_064567 [Elysia crispata]